jgi:phosphate transport system substrate-binding protein
MSGVVPTYETIANFTYPGARPLFIYVKKAHVDAIPGLREYVAEWTELWGKDGPLAKAGMIAMPDDKLSANAKIAQDLTPLDAGSLK